MRTNRRIIASAPEAPPSECLEPRCNELADPDAPIALCERHLRLAFAYMLESARLASPAEPPASPAEDSAPGWVYFIRKGDELKIGYTANPPHRFRALRPDEVLHLQPGSMQDERQCHQAFAHLRLHGEWFRPAPDLLAFIDALRVSA